MAEKPYSEMNEAEREQRQLRMVANVRWVWRHIYNGGQMYDMTWRRSEKTSGTGTEVWTGYARRISNNQLDMVAVCAGTEIAPQPYDNEGNMQVTLFTLSEWDAWVAGAKDGEFDL